MARTLTEASLQRFYEAIELSPERKEQDWKLEKRARSMFPPVNPARQAEIEREEAEEKARELERQRSEWGQQSRQYKKLQSRLASIPRAMRAKETDKPPREVLSRAPIQSTAERLRDVRTQASKQFPWRSRISPISKLYPRRVTRIISDPLRDELPPIVAAGWDRPVKALSPEHAGERVKRLRQLMAMKQAAAHRSKVMSGFRSAMSKVGDFAQKWLSGHEVARLQQADRFVDLRRTPLLIEAICG